MSILVMVEIPGVHSCHGGGTSVNLLDLKKYRNQFLTDPDFDGGTSTVLVSLPATNLFPY